MARTAQALILAVAALLPFERLGAFPLAGMNVRPSQVVLAIAWLAWLRTFSCDRKNSTWRRPSYAWLAAFLGVAALSLLQTEHLSRSLLIFGFTAFTASLAVLVPATLDDAGLAKARHVILVSAALVGAFGLWQFVADMAGLPTALTGLREHYTKAILGFTRIQSTAAEPLYFADYLLLPLGLGISWLLAGADRDARSLGALMGLLLICLTLTSSRGGYAGFAALALVLAWSYRSRLSSMKRLIGLAALGLAALGLAFSLLGAFFTTSREPIATTFLNHVTNVFDGAAFVERADTFGLAVEAFLRHPWLGVGIGGYGPYVATFAHVRPDAGWAIVNNQALELLAETGLFGFAVFVGFLLALFREGTRRGRPATEPIRLGALAALVGMLFQYQTFSTLYVMHVWFAVGLLLAASGRHTEDVTPRA